MSAPAAAAIDILMDDLGHEFTRPELLLKALTHHSAAPEGRGGSYERFEFLGDRVLGLAVADLLLSRFPEEDEGDLAHRFSGLVSRQALVSVARGIGLGAYLQMAPGEATSGLRDNETVLADAMEASLGAVYLDSGFAAAQMVITRLWRPMTEADEAPPRDAKTALQEWAQSHGKGLPKYAEVARTGPDHAPVFTVEARLTGMAPAEGRGGSKQAAEQQAAEAMLATVAASFEENP